MKSIRLPSRRESSKKPQLSLSRAPITSRQGNRSRFERAVLFLLFAVLLTRPALPQTVTATLNVGSSPAAIAVNPVTSTVYVVNSAGNSVSVINGATNSVTATVSTGTNPVAVAVNSLTNTVYVANNGSNNITVINGANNTASTVTDPNAIAPVALALDPLTNMVYVADSGSNNLTVINGAGNTVAATVGVGTNPSAVVVNPATNTVFVANRASSNVTVVNGASNTVAATVDVGTNPTALTVDAATNMVYVANNGSNNVSVIAGASDTVVATIGTGTSPAAVAVNPITDTVYVANSGSSNVTVINGSNNTVTATVTVGNSPVAVAADPTTNEVYVANNASNNVTVIAGATNATTTVADPNATALVALAVDPVTNTVYVANNGSSNVTVIDADSNLVTTTLSTGTNPVGVALNTVTKTVYVVNTASGTVTVIDGTTNSVVTTVTVGTNPVAIAVNPATNMVYVANSGNNTLTVIDGANNSVAATINTGTNPVAVAVNPVTNTVYVANNGSGNVTVIDGANNSATTTVTVGTAPAAVAVNTATGQVYVANNGSDNITVFDPVVSTNLTITDLAASRPIALAVNLLTNRIYIANSYSDNVTVINGATAAVVATINVGNNPTALALNPITNRIYVTNTGNNTVSVIDGNANAVIATVTAGTAPSAVSVNPTSNRIYVANNGNGSTDLGSITVIDGSSNTAVTVTDPTANKPYALASNPLTDELYVANNLSSNISVITAEQIQSNPITVAIAPLSGNETSNETPTFDFTATNGFSTAPVDSLLFQMDTWQGSWTPATPTIPRSFTGTTTTLLPGFHTLFAYAAEGDEATSTTTGSASSPLLGTISAYGFLVATPIADVAPPSLSFGNQQVGMPSPPQTVTVGNPGSATLTFSYALAPGVFSEGAGDTCISAGGQLAPNTSCTISVVFNPSASGSAASTLTVTDNSNSISGSQQIVSLTGTGITSSFSLNVAVGGSGSGSVTSNPAGIICPTTCASNYSTGTQVTLTATPNAGSTFIGWSGACAGVGTCTVTMNSNQAATATFMLIAATACTGTTTNWIGGASGNWNNPAHWSTGVVPNSSSVNVCINDGASPSQVTLDINASVGTLTIDAGSSLTISNNTQLAANGNIFNAGQISISAAGNLTYLTIAAPVSLSGGGTVILSKGGNGTAVIQTAGGSQTLTNVNNTIQGTGTIGYNGLLVVNQAGGIINANAPSSSNPSLLLNPSAFTNQGLLEATATGTLQLEATINNAGGRILASGSGSTVQFYSGTVQGGTLTSSNSGTLTAPGTIFTLDGSSQGTLTIVGTYVVGNNGNTSLLGTINNTGTIQVAAVGNLTYLTMAAPVSLMGNGIVSLSTGGNGTAVIQTAGGAQTLTNVNNTLQGFGTIGFNGLVVVNQAGGVINANTAGNVALLLNPANLTNQGLLESTGGGTLNLQNTFYNAGGKILATGTNSTVQFISGTVQGGTLSTASSGILTTPGGDTFTLDGTTLGTLNIAGTFVVANNGNTELLGTINNTGAIQVNAGGNLTYLTIAAPVSLTGAGTVTLTKNGNGTAIIQTVGGDQTLTNVNNTILGTGTIGYNGLVLVNQGTINANLPAQGILELNPNGLTNEGLLEATAGATLQLNGTTFNNTGGNILASGTGSNVQFANNAVIQSGMISENGGGSLGVASGNTLSLDGNAHGPLTIAGTYTANNNSNTFLYGTINNTGIIQVAAAGNATYLTIASSVSLVGNGVVSLSTSSNGTAILQANGGQSLTNVDNTLQGFGVIGPNGLSVTNQGTINANVSGATLTLDPSGFTNQGLLEATSGGILSLSASTINNQKGTITVNGATSSVQFVSNATIQGGTITSLNNGVLTGEGMTLDGSSRGALTNAGTFVVANNTSTTLLGTINNTGSIQVNALGNLTYLTIAAPVSLQGGGAVTLTKNGNGTAVIQTAGGSQTLTNVNNMISGTGTIGYNGLVLVNQGTINANLPTEGILELNPSGLTNPGLLEATAGATLQLNGTTFNNAAGTISASGTSSNVQFANGAVIQSGTLSSASGGNVNVASGNTITLDGSTHGQLTIVGIYTDTNNSNTILIGNINNTGTIQVAAAGNLTYLTMAGAVNLIGSGVVTLSTSGNGTAVLQTTGGAQLLTNVNNTLQGFGTIGFNGLEVTNQGTINANTSGSTLTLNPSVFSNQGLLEATSGGILSLSGSTISNPSGTIQVNGATSSVQFVNNATIEGGTVSGINGGVLTGNGMTLDGSTLGPLTVSGTYAVSNNTSTTLLGTINNTGTIQVNAAGNLTYLSIGGPLNLTGNGVVTLSTSGNGTAILQTANGTHLLTNVNNTLQGFGTIGYNGLQVTNQGTINANTSGKTLTLNPGAFTNVGLLEATGSSTLQVSATVNNAGGSIVANGSGTAVQFANGITIQGGTLNTIGGGFLGSVSGTTLTLDGTANAVSITAGGTYTVGNNSTTNILGTINNNGTVLLNSTGNTTALSAPSGATLTGGGMVLMTSSANVITGPSLLNAGNTILDLAAFNISSYTQSAGLFQVAATGLASTTSFSLNGGIAQVDGNLAASGSLSATGTGTFSGAGTITGNVNMSGVTEAGDIPNPGRLTINGNGVGNYTQGSAGSYDVLIGGLSAGTQYSQLNMSGTASLSGTLNVSLINSFIPAAGNQFTILAAASLNGQFTTTNLPSLSSGLNWIVSYTSTSVVLSVASSESFTLTVTTLGTGNGTVTDNLAEINCTDTAGVQTGTCSASYIAGTTVNLTATPVSPTTFGGWGGACTGTAGCSVIMNSAQSVTAAFVPVPVTLPVPFSCPGGVYPCSNVTPPPAVFNCPSNTNPCTDPNAHSLALTATTVNSPFTMTVAANEVSSFQADGDCQSGQNPSTDFDCRFTSFFPYETLANGDIIVPICDAYSNGNCVFYSVYFGVKGTEPPPTDYAGPISWSIAWNNTSFLPPPTYPYQTNNPRLYDDPDYEVSTTTPYGTNCSVPMLIDGNPTDPAIYCQFVFDITTYYNPTQPPDAGIGGKTKQFNDVVVAFPLTVAAPNLSVTKTADQSVVNLGSPIGYTVTMSNSSAAGTGTATNAVLNDPLPAGSAVNWTISPAYTGLGTCTITGSAPAQTLTCALGSMSPAISASVHVSSSNSSAGSYVNIATLSADNNPPVTASATIQVLQATPTITWPTPAPITYGTPLSSTQLDATASVQGTFAYTPPAGTILGAGLQTLSVLFTPTDINDYTTATDSVSLQVNKAGSTTSIVSSIPNPSDVGQTVVISFLVTGTGVPTGSVTVSATTGESCTGSLATGAGSCSIVFSTAGTRTLTASYGGDSNFNGSSSQGLTQVVNASGPIATLSPSGVSFGGVYLGRFARRLVTLTNTGTAPMTVSSIKISPPGKDTEDFLAISSCPSTLDVGKGCTIVVTFFANKDNRRVSARLAVTDNAPGSPQLVPLSATVINPKASLNPTVLNFGDQKVGTTSPAKKVTLINTGISPLVLSSIAVSGNFALASGTTCSNGTSLAPASSCVMNVTFTPTAIGMQYGRLTIRDNALPRTQEVALSGTGD